MASPIMASSSTASSSMEASFAMLEIHEHIRTPLTFHGFSKLPQEVQNMIWGFVILNFAKGSPTETRVVVQRKFRQFPYGNQTPYPQGAQPAFPNDPVELFFAAPYGMPSVLQVSLKLSAEALKHLPFPLRSWFEGEQRQHYFNFDEDVLFLEEPTWFTARTTGNETALHWSITKWEKIRSIRRIALMMTDRTAPGLLLTSLKDNGRMRFWVGYLLMRLVRYMTHGNLKEVLLLIPRSLNYYAQPGMVISKLDLHKSLVGQFPRKNLDVESQSLEGILQTEWSRRMGATGKQINLSIRYAEFQLPL